MVGQCPTIGVNERYQSIRVLSAKCPKNAVGVVYPRVPCQVSFHCPIQWLRYPSLNALHNALFPFSRMATCLATDALTVDFNHWFLVSERVLRNSRGPIGAINQYRRNLESDGP